MNKENCSVIARASDTATKGLTIAAQKPTPWQGRRWVGWERREAFDSVTKERVTVFSFTATTPEHTAWLPRLFKSLQKARTFRHPAVLRYIDVSLDGNSLVAVTEVVDRCLADPVPHTDEALLVEEAILGLNKTIRALDFLHTTCQILHNNLTTASIFIAPDGTWRLGGLEFCLPIDELGTPSYEGLMTAIDVMAQVPPEKLPSSDASVVIPHLSDMYALSKLIESLLQSHITSQRNQTSHSLLLEMISNLQRLSDVPIPTLLLDAQVFTEHSLVDVVQALDNFTILDNEGKHRFFSALPLQLQQVSSAAFTRFIAPRLLTPLMFNEPHASLAFKKIFTPKNSQAANDGGPLEPSAFQACVVPFIVDLFSRRQLRIRVTLLSLFEYFVFALPPDLVRRTIVPEVILGLDDTSDEIRTLSFSALCLVIPLVIDTITPAKRPQRLDPEPDRLAVLSGAPRYTAEELLNGTLIPVLRDMIFMTETITATQQQLIFSSLFRLWSEGYSGLAELRSPQLLPLQLTRLIREAPVDWRVRFFTDVLATVLPQSVQQRFIVQAIIPLTSSFLLDVDGKVRAAAHQFLLYLFTLIRDHDGEDTSDSLSPSNWKTTPMARVSRFVDVGLKRSLTGLPSPSVPSSGIATPAVTTISLGSGSSTPAITVPTSTQTEPTTTPAPTSNNTTRPAPRAGSQITEQPQTKAKAPVSAPTPAPKKPAPKVTFDAIGFESDDVDPWDAEGWGSQDPNSTPTQTPTKPSSEQNSKRDTTTSTNTEPESINGTATSPTLSTKQSSGLAALSADERKAKRDARRNELQAKRRVAEPPTAQPSHDAASNNDLDQTDADDTVPLSVAAVPAKGMSLAAQLKPKPSKLQASNKPSSETASAAPPPALAVQQQAQSLPKPEENVVPKEVDFFDLVEKEPIKSSAKVVTPRLGVNSSRGRGARGGRTAERVTKPISDINNAQPSHGTTTPEVQHVVEQSTQLTQDVAKTSIVNKEDNQVNTTSTDVTSISQVKVASISDVEQPETIAWSVDSVDKDLEALLDDQAPTVNAENSKQDSNNTSHTPPLALNQQDFDLSPQNHQTEVITNVNETHNDNDDEIDLSVNVTPFVPANSASFGIESTAATAAIVVAVVVGGDSLTDNLSNTVQDSDYDQELQKAIESELNDIPSSTIGNDNDAVPVTSNNQQDVDSSSTTTTPPSTADATISSPTVNSSEQNDKKKKKKKKKKKTNAINANVDTSDDEADLI